jgi:hypothetical protein
MPSTISTIAAPGKTPVHQMPLAVSERARFRSYPHSAAAVGPMPNPRKPRAARVRIASDALSVRIRGRLRVALRRTCLNMMRPVLLPLTLADSTNASALSLVASARTTRKYCGTYTTVIEMPAETMPPQRLDWPPLMTIETTMASSSEGNA